MKQIPLTNGGFTLVDDEDFERLNQYKWRKTKRKNTSYVLRGEYVSRGNDKCVLMHREILGLTDRNIHVDHRDGDGLNNQRENLRECIQSENGRNCGLSSNNTTGFKGVSFHIRANKYIAMIMVNRKSIYLGLHDTAIKAARAYDEAAVRLHGEFARLNFQE